MLLIQAAELGLEQLCQDGCLTFLQSLFAAFLPAFLPAFLQSLFAPLPRPFLHSLC